MLIRRFPPGGGIVDPEAEEANEIIEGGRSVADEGAFLMIRKGSVGGRAAGVAMGLVDVGREDGGGREEEGVR